MRRANRATWKRKLQFRSGPQQAMFYACDEHKHNIEGDGKVSPFFAREKDAIEVNGDGELPCDFCYDGGGE